MTLQQLKYAAAIAAAGTISEAAQALSIAQPSLTLSLIHILESTDDKARIKAALERPACLLCGQGGNQRPVYGGKLPGHGGF